MSEKAAAALLDAGAFLVRPDEPFRLTSGLLAPFYINCRQILSHPDARSTIVEALTQTVPCPSTTMIAGGVTAGVPFATLVADRLSLPLVYVRTKAKQHGTASQIEGGEVAGETVLLVEDLITTAGSILGFVQTLRRGGAKVLFASVLFSRANKPALRSLDDAGLVLTTLCDLDTLLTVAIARRNIDEKQLTEVRTFLQDPQRWTINRPD